MGSELSDETMIRTSNAPYLTQPSIRSFWDLQPFYAGLAKFGLFNTLDKEITEQTTVKMLEDALDQEYLDLN